MDDPAWGPELLDGVVARGGSPSRDATVASQRRSRHPTAPLTIERPTEVRRWRSPCLVDHTDVHVEQSPDGGVARIVHASEQKQNVSWLTWTF